MGLVNRYREFVTQKNENNDNKGQVELEMHQYMCYIETCTYYIGLCALLFLIA